MPATVTASRDEVAMDLILWRHADAREGGDDLSDLNRPLSPRGERQAQRMAQWLHRHLPDNTRVLASPALRTRQTAQAFTPKFKLVDELAPDRSPTELLHAARWPDAGRSVLVVGHQPALGLTAAYLLAGGAAVTGAWTIRKGAIWWLRRRERGGQAEVLLHMVIGPEQV
jgi:phosphohistidine phosphatase